MNYNTEVEKVIKLSPDYFILRTKRPENFDFRPGQFVSMGLTSLGINREYSITSGVADNWLDFLIRLVPDGTLTPYLADVEFGHKIEIQGPYGDFFSTKVDGKTALIGSGSGVAPFMSIERSNVLANFDIWHCIREDEDNVQKFLTPSTRYIKQISSDVGRIQSRIDISFREEYSDFFLCGNRLMITDLHQVLEKAGVSTSNIHTEVFF